MTDDMKPPSPVMMPKRKPEIKPRQPAPISATFKISLEIPKRGWPDATVWPDTGVLLAVATNQDLLTRFRVRYISRSRVARRVNDELRAHSNRASRNNLRDIRAEAASAAVQKLFIDRPSFSTVQLEEEDLVAVEQIKAQLRKVPGAKDEKGSHGGEAEIIALAKRQAGSGRRQVMLSNDGGASMVAASHGIPTRHVGDVINELVCEDTEPSLTDAYLLFLNAIEVSSPPKMSYPNEARGIDCARKGSECSACERIDGKATG